ncbi:hypothetical protein J7E87_01470 [Streptomyces sp. ISL-1]|uniref:hypothetical protein n=1 Tax=Streptomyces sp. ISL-1 TaxID=2817657 RepID=UPI001BE81BB0|nr:hypothetical protein [Streptomyces sp. ISL-1]MBT2388118.1 hypothetical protein [Streptomyces sp. ISL-1]
MARPDPVIITYVAVTSSTVTSGSTGRRTAPWGIHAPSPCPPSVDHTEARTQ